MISILISACLHGEPVRYNGGSIPLEHPLLIRWQAEGRLVPFCPERAGGLPIPRPEAEIVGLGGKAVLGERARVVERTGKDVTAAFVAGAQQALVLAQSRDCRLAVLTEKSPSCGISSIYDGSFSGTLRTGSGVMAALLIPHGIKVFNQHQLDEAAAYLELLHQPQ